MKNLSFEDGWETLPPTGNAGYLQNQRPNDWELTILPPEAVLWDSTDKATGEPECVHKLASQLPPDERPGGSDPLILDGQTVYKIFHSGAAYGVQLRQVVGGLQPGSEATAVVNIRVHDHQGTDPYGVEFRMMTNGKGGWWHKEAGLENFKWVDRRQTRTIGDDGLFELIVQLKSKYKLPVDIFLDAFEFEGVYADDGPPPPPPPEETECRGKPRVQYSRVYLAAPQDISESDWLKICAAAYKDRRTVGFSADDAMIGDLDKRTAVFYGLPLEKHAEYLAFRDEYYPGVEVVFENLPGADDEAAYTGPAVTALVAGVDNPASDWRWPQARVVFERTGLYPKYHAGGNNYAWWDDFKSPMFNLVRILVAPDYVGDLLDETRANIAQFFSRGARDFEVLNEPNVEGMGSRWSNGVEFGVRFWLYCRQLKAAFPGIRLWFPGMSPQFGGQYGFIDAAVSVGAFDYIYGICQHVYTGIVDDGETAVNQMMDEVLAFRQRYALKRPLIVSEFSVNRPAAAVYKAGVYHEFYRRLALVDGVQAAYCFTSDWEPQADEDQEGWLRWGIVDAW